MENENLHHVEIDEEAAKLTFAKFGKSQEYIPAGNQLPPPQGESESIEPPPSEDNWQKPAELLAMVINGKLVPAWEVPEEEWQKWAEALSDCLEQLFPGGIGNIDSWGPWAKLAFASGSIAVAGIDFETMTFKPRHPVEEEAEEVTPGEPANDEVPRPAQGSGGSFVIGGA